MPEKDTGLLAAGIGIVGTLYTGIQIFILRSFSGRISAIENKKNTNIPRPECERTHAGVDNTLIDIKKVMADGFKEMNSKVDTGFKDVREQVGEVHQRINEGR